MKANKAMRGRKCQTTGEQESNQRVALIWLHTIKLFNNKTTKWQELPHAYQY
jgi:hypothetical protein